LAVHIRIIDVGRKEIDRLDDGQIFGQPIDAGVIVRVGADQKVRIVAGRKVAQDLRDALGGKLACSAAARGKVDQTFFLPKKQHDAFSLRNRLRPRAATLSRTRLVDAHASLFLLRMGAERFQHPFLLRELSGFQFGIEQFPIECQLEAASLGRNQLHLLNLLLERCQ
jgi:hypothetical protein